VMNAGICRNLSGIRLIVSAELIIQISRGQRGMRRRYRRPIGSTGVRRRPMKGSLQSVWDVGAFRKACDGSDEGGRIDRLRNVHLKSGVQCPFAIVIGDQGCHCGRRDRGDCG
jgi:hypothetical protein